MVWHPSAAAESVSCSPRRPTVGAPVTATERAAASRAEGTTVPYSMEATPWW
ncbi:hypothetical protein HEP81_01659 [Streptomyces griseofuscus]|uniref:Uncharacterized protein n=1 Tax=Streptomyces griseofuscus TaxID=146922 RepID=A0A7H1PVA8_9ACTN|nr:hypothetical protein HEP81_01659 [Streptomyces griseofuscus]